MAARHRIAHTDSTFEPGPEFVADDALYASILAGPRIYESDEEAEWAFVFGPAYPAASYARIGEQSGSVPNTALFDLDELGSTARRLGVTENEVVEEAQDAIADAYESSPKGINDPSALARLQANVPWILFLGDTPGDVGSRLYGHRSRSGKLDGIILDSWHFFDEDGTVVAEAAAALDAEAEAAAGLPERIGKAGWECRPEDRVPELRRRAKELGIRNYSRLTREALCNAIREALSGVGGGRALHPSVERLASKPRRILTTLEELRAIEEAEAEAEAKARAGTAVVPSVGRAAGSPCPPGWNIVRLREEARRTGVHYSGVRKEELCVKLRDARKCAGLPAW